jgi:hypothetical protein
MQVGPCWFGSLIGAKCLANVGPDPLTKRVTFCAEVVTLNYVCLATQCHS